MRSPTNVPLSTTGTQPIFLSAISWAASLIGVSGLTLITLFFITSLISTVLSRADLRFCFKSEDRRCRRANQISFA